MRSQPRTRFCALALASGVLTLAACPEKENESDSATAPTTTTPTTETTATPTTETTEAPTTEATTDEAPTGTTTDEAPTGTTTEAPTGTTTESVTEGTTTEGTTTEGTTGEPSELEAACQSACVVFFDCVPRPPFPDMVACTADCVGALGQGEGCLEATVAFNSCLGEMTCEQFEAAFIHEDFGPCEDEFTAMLGSCQV